MQDVINAIGDLQGRSMREWRTTSSELLDVALDDLVANPQRTGDRRHLAGSAIARARTRLANRRRIAPLAGTLDEIERSSRVGRRVVVAPAADDWVCHERLMLMDALERAPLAERDRRYALLSALGFTPREVAAADGDPVDVVRVRMSRARARVQGALR